MVMASGNTNDDIFIGNICLACVFFSHAEFWGQLERSFICALSKNYYDTNLPANNF